MNLLKIFSFLILLPAVALGQTPKSHVKAELVSASEHLVVGSSLLVGIHLKMDPHWHVYWRNPGDSGEATKVHWDLPEGLSVGPLLWPTPKRIPVPPLVNFGYDDEALLLTEVVVGNPTQSAQKGTLRAKVEWLECADICVPGKTELQLELPWGKEEHPSTWKEPLEKARAALPAADGNWKASVQVTADKIRLRLKGPADGITTALYFPYSETLLQNAAVQSPVIDGNTIFLELARSNLNDSPRPTPEEISGIVVLDGASPKTLEILPTYESGFGNLLEALLLAFLGGIVLNLMPCVFPVLCLKVLSFAQMGKAHRRHALSHAAGYTAGILVSFWVLAGTLIALRAGGQSLGWGFQLQSPAFLAALAFLLVGLSLNLFGVFEVGDSLMGVGQKWAAKEGWAGTFFSGVLATVVATPCTAPFMGTAMGYALAQPAPLALGVFTSLGLGLAFPYVFFSGFPQLTDRLPRPGNWMITLKQLMAFPLLVTAWWLISVLALQSSLEIVFQLLLALLVFALGLWVYGLQTKRKMLRILVAVALVGASVAWSITEIHRAPRASHSANLADGWQNYSEEALTAARRSGQPVFIDFTAAWCITCQVNERVALSVQSVQDKFKEKKVVLFRADWTNQDAAIAKKLESFGRNGVPLYVLYPPGEKSEPRILPQILTPDMVLTALESL